MRDSRHRPTGRPWLIALAIVMAGGALSACASAGRRSGGATSHPPGVDSSVMPEAVPRALAEVIAHVRALAAEGRPPRNDAAQSVETWDPLLSAALAELEVEPTAAHHAIVGEAYRQLGILDSAYTHFTEAIALDPGLAAAYDGRARLWRDQRLPAPALEDAARAVALAPDSPAAITTLGTAYELTGDLVRAREQYARAAVLDPGATYTMMNLCHVDTMLGRGQAFGECQRAVAAAPRSRVAHNNMAIAYASAGAFDRAGEEFRSTADPATASYNLGVLYMAASRYAEAASAFRTAWRTDASKTPAVARLRQLEALVAR